MHPDVQSSRENGAANDTWKAEIAAYDAECAASDQEFRRRHTVISDSGSAELTAEENEVFACVLRGIPCSEIAEMYGVEESLVTGLVEIIRAKLALSD